MRVKSTRGTDGRYIVESPLVRQYPKEYDTWSGMKKRCRNPEKYKNWAGRGITYSSDWESFANFMRDMGPRPKGDYSLERIDNDGNYCKENCKWATRHEQARNKRQNVHVMWEGKKYCLWDLAEKLGITYNVVVMRRLHGWDTIKALTTPIKHKLKKESCGELQN